MGCEARTINDCLNQSYAVDVTYRGDKEPYRAILVHIVPSNFLLQPY
jgi:hypothetical protein